MDSFDKIITAIPPQKGNYILIFQAQEDALILVGALGLQSFPAGTYAYVGSALGPGGLRARVKHHLRPSPKPHWHMDYLKPLVSWLAVEWAVSIERMECIWAQRLILAGGTTPVKGFGASDCQNHCAAHLIYFDSSTPRPREILQIDGHIDIMYNKANF